MSPYSLHCSHNDFSTNPLHGVARSTQYYVAAEDNEKKNRRPKATFK